MGSRHFERSVLGAHTGQFDARRYNLFKRGNYDLTSRLADGAFRLHDPSSRDQDVTTCVRFWPTFAGSAYI
jgi:hypothetical protein